MPAAAQSSQARSAIRRRAAISGLTSPYYINNGKLVTQLLGTPFEITAYKLGDKYYGARSNEFGYANYEIIPPIKELNPLDVLR